MAEFEAQPLEGTNRSVYAVLRFTSEEAARNWHGDPNYEPVRKIRLDSCANNSLVLAKPFVPPSA